MIAIVDYGMGNIRSVEKAFTKIGTEAKVTSDTKALTDSRGIVLPGVGAFRDCMKNLDELRLLDVIVREVRKGKPYLGICLGLQILFSESEEFGICRGLDLCKGRVTRFRFDGQPGSEDLKVPHMGWNTVRLQRVPPAARGVPDGSYFYFVHSYYVVPEDETIVAGRTDYGIDFVSMVWDENIVATQFHPEKSQQAGLRLLDGFSRFVKES
jgi:imidazole glycerol-phosphate synthase subunit HisH